MTGKRKIARTRVIGGVAAGIACASLPASVAAQTAGNDAIKQL
jgi:hypothetical protein